MRYWENTTFRQAKPAFLRCNGKFALEAFIYNIFLNRHSGNYIISKLVQNYKQSYRKL